MTGRVNTENQVRLAYDAGGTQAYAEYLLGLRAPEGPPPLDDEDTQDLAFRVTGEKLDPEGERAQELVYAYEDGYLDKWDVMNNGD